jgi:hypothetical protein
MFCSECGKPARGKFCSQCGSPLDVTSELAPLARPDPSTIDTQVIIAEVAIDWEREVRYEALLRDSRVRELVDSHARLAKKRMSGEQFLSIADKLIPQPISMEGLAAIAQPFWAKLGVKTGKHLAADIDAPPARVIVRTMCSLARAAQPIQNVMQHEDGCTIDAELPSDLFALAGTLSIEILRSAQRTRVTAATNIAGQWMDWGKSRRALEKLFTDLRQEPVLIHQAA